MSDKCKVCDGEGTVSPHSEDVRGCPWPSILKGIPGCACDEVECEACREPEFESRSQVRCPYCLHIEPASDCEGIYEVEDQRSYDNVCGSCGGLYDVVAVIDTTFVSPAKGERCPR